MTFKNVTNILCEDDDRKPIVCQFQIDEEKIIPGVSFEFRERILKTSGNEKVDVLNKARAHPSYLQFKCGGEIVNLGNTNIEFGNIVGKNNDFICSQISRASRKKLGGNQNLFPFGEAGVVCKEKSVFDKIDDELDNCKIDLKKAKNSKPRCTESSAKKIVHDNMTEYISKTKSKNRKSKTKQCLNELKTFNLL